VDENTQIAQQWQSHEPDNYRVGGKRGSGSGEHFMHLSSSSSRGGVWNDWTWDRADVEGYVCEWGGVGELCVDEEATYGTSTLYYDCNVHTNEGTCIGYDPICVWTPAGFSTGSCVSKGCQSHHDEETCVHDLDCMWDGHADPKVCTHDYCVYTHGTDHAACDADIGPDPGTGAWGGPCHWNVAQNKCKKLHCSDVTDKCECLAITPLCEWDPTRDVGGSTGSCIDPRYAKCPGADVVFLVDGSGSMKNDFGSHSHGYRGLLEELRGWLHDVDLAPAPDTDWGIQATLIQFSGEAWQCKMDGTGCATDTGSFCDSTSGCDAGRDDWYGRNCKIRSQDRMLQCRCDDPRPGKGQSANAVGQPYQCTDGEMSGRPLAVGSTLMSPRQRLDVDIDWHEENYQSWGTYVAAALTKSEEVLQHAIASASGHTRKRYIFIITDGIIADRDSTIRQIEQKIEALPDHPQIFGVVIEKSPGMTNTRAVTKLKPLTSEDPPGSGNHDKFFLNVDLDHFKVGIMDQLCDPSSPFGKVLVDNSNEVLCSDHKTTSTCDDDLRCLYHAAPSNKCEDSECIKICMEVPCNQDPRCAWNTEAKYHANPDGLCLRKPPGCETQTDKPGCKAWGTGNDCLWDADWDLGKCIDNPCFPQQGEASCHDVFVSWPGCTPVCDPSGCTDPKCKVNICDWDGKLGAGLQCTLKHCLHTLQARCELEDRNLPAGADCEWKAPSPLPTVMPGPMDQADWCVEKICQHTSMSQCENDPLCEWDGTGGGTCVPKPCTEHRHSEAECEQDKNCEFDVATTPASCKQTACGENQVEAACNGMSTTCYWDSAAPAACIPLTCGVYTEQCPCNNDANCEWHKGSTGTGHCVAHKYTTCPDLDIAFLIDASASMHEPFEAHPKGTEAVMEAIHKWMKTIPLSGSGTATAGEGKFRVTFSQYSKMDATAAEMHTTSCGDCTNGLLSGEYSKLLGDVQFIERNSMLGRSYIAPAAAHTTDNVFGAPVTGRQQVVFIVGDGGFDDQRGCGDCDKTSCCTAGVPGCSADCAQDAGWAPDKQQAYLDVQPKFDATKTVFGVIVQRSVAPTAAEINRVKVLTELGGSTLNYQTVKVSQLKTILEGICDSTTQFGGQLAPAAASNHLSCSIWGFKDECHADKLCEWKSPAIASCSDASECPNLGCRPVPAKFAPMACSKCRLQRGGINCDGAYTNQMQGYCADTDCKKLCTQTDCVGNCEWEASSTTCVRKVCKHADQAACDNDPDHLCHIGTGGTCELKQCLAVFEENHCAADTKCEWDKGPDPPGCIFKDLCPDETTEAGCVGQEGCFWDCGLGLVASAVRAFAMSPQRRSAPPGPRSASTGSTRAWKSSAPGTTTLLAAMLTVRTASGCRATRRRATRTPALVWPPARAGHAKRTTCARSRAAPAFSSGAGRTPTTSPSASTTTAATGTSLTPPLPAARSTSAPSRT
jgi:hypothetical protein